MKAAASVSTDIHVVMGVSASGKSTVGRLLAQARGATYLDGDDFHPPENVARMATGQALTDADRQGWLSALRARLAQARTAREGVVLWVLTGGEMREDGSHAQRCAAHGLE